MWTPAQSFVRDKTGTAVVEFSLLLPFLLVLLFGAVDVTDGVAARRKVTLVANTVSDLVAQVKNVDGTYADKALAAGSSVITPFDASALTSVISSVIVDANGKATVLWSLGKNASPRPKGEVFPLPSVLKVPNTSLVAAEVVFGYKPIVGHAFTGTLTMSETAYALPRVAAATAGVTCSAPGC
jgi:Flp pilus assembly protein TadG